MSRLFRLRLGYNSNSAELPQTLIVKLPSADSLLRTVFDRLGQNRREVRFYRELASNVLLQTPRGYYCGIDPANGNTVLMLEDMSYARQGDSVAGCSLDEARRCIGQLARFQAAWWNSPLLDRHDWMSLKDAEAIVYQEMYSGAWESLVQKAGDGMPRNLRLLGDRLAPEVPKIKSQLSRPPITIVHGDFRLDNCFFHPSGDRHSVTVIDWEFCDGVGVLTMLPPSSARHSLQSNERKKSSVSCKNITQSWKTMGCGATPLTSACMTTGLSMLEIFVFWIITGGYCDYEDERAKRYLRNTLERLDAAISDLASTETLGLQ